MKEETRKLLNKIINDYNDRYAIPPRIDEEKFYKAMSYNDRQDKIQEFLKSIPEIEKHLTEGGYIQDSNKKICCNDDKVRFEFEEKIYEECFKEKGFPLIEEAH